MTLQRINEAFAVKNEDTGEPMAHVRYRIEDDAGNVVGGGTTDLQGRTERIHTGAAQQIHLFLLDD